MKITGERLGTLVVVVFVVVAGVVLVVHPGQPASSTRPILSGHSSPKAVAKDKVSTPPPAEFFPIGEVKLDPVTRDNITEAVRTWAAYPNHQGRTATLATLRLNRTVSAVALAGIARQWARPQTDPVNVVADAVAIQELPVFASTTQATFEGSVRLSKQYSDGKITRVSGTVDVLLTKAGGVWIITGLFKL